MASIDRTAYPRFKRVVAARELAEAFTPTSDEVAWTRDKTQSDPHLLALAVRLKAYQRLGYFPKLPDIPAAVVDTVRSVLGLPDEVSPETDADRTAKRHRQFVREYLGVKYEAAKVRAVADQAIRTAVDTDDLATITPYITHTIRRMGDLVLNLSPPERTPVTRLDLEPRVLFAPRT